MEYGLGTPCDSFWLRCPWQAGGETSPADWVTFTGEHEGERGFTGVVDECEVTQSGQGGVLELCWPSNGTICMTGPAETVFEGEYPL